MYALRAYLPRWIVGIVIQTSNMADEEYKPGKDWFKNYSLFLGYSHKTRSFLFALTPKNFNTVIWLWTSNISFVSDEGDCQRDGGREASPAGQRLLRSLAHTAFEV